MIKNGIRTLMLLGIILVIGVMVKEATAEITIDNDLIISEDLTIQNERVIIIANLTCIGNATLTIDGCMVQMGIVNSSKPAIIQIYNNSSLIIRDSNFSRIVGTAFYQIKIESFGIVEITNSSFYEGGKGSPEFLEIFSISNASLRFDRIKFKDCLAGVTLSNLFNINLTNVSWVHTQKTGMKLIDCTNSVIVDSEINGHMDGVGISVENCEGVFLRNCTFSDNEIGIQSSGGTGFLIVERCTFVRSTRVAIVFVNHGSLSGPEIKNCQFYEDNIGFTTDPLGGLTTHGSIENLLISNCSFNINSR